MTLVSSIRTSLSKVGRKFADGVIEYRVLTSNPNANPKTYGTWTLVPYSRCVEFSESQLQDPDDGMWYREETCEVRIPFEANVALSIKDQVRQGPTAAGVGLSNVVWSVREQKMAAAGAVSAYGLYRRTPLMANPRKGGI